MRLPLTTLEVFTAIAHHGSLNGAASALGIKPSTVSHQLKALEKEIGTALFIRTTRSINLTDAGRVLFRGAGPAFEQLGEAVEGARTAGETEKGVLKLAMPEFIYQMLIRDVLPSFCKTYPDVEVELSMADSLSDIREEEFHAGFRLGDRIVETMLAVRLTSPLSMFVGASPEYLAQYGTPLTPKDLLAHKCIRYRYQTSKSFSEWTFHSDEGKYVVDVKGQMIANTVPAKVDLAKQGLGFIYTFRDYCAQELAQGDLVAVLEDYLVELPGIYIYFPIEYRSMRLLRLFIDHTKSTLPIV